MATLGSYTSAAGIPRLIEGVTVLNLDGTPAGVSTGATNRSTTAQTTAKQLMPANAARKNIVIKNDSTVDVWINLIGTATAAAGAGNIRIAAGGYFELNAYSGAVSIVSTADAAITAYEF